MSEPDSRPLFRDVQVFALPKVGHREEEYEDAAAWMAPLRGPLWAAVADGATEAAFARDWAQCLVAGFVEEGRGGDSLGEQLPAWQAGWREAVGARAQRLPWFAEAKVAQGAYAAFLGLTLEKEGTWHALAVGDCCLFHLRDEAVLTSWPFTDAAAFTHRPALLSSLPEHALPPVVRTAGRWRAGDVFLLATDALAAWLLRTGPISALAFTAETFATDIATAHRNGDLRNDDVTLVRIELR